MRLRGLSPTHKNQCRPQEAALGWTVPKLAGTMGLEPTTNAVPWTVLLIQGAALPLSYVPINLLNI